MKKIHAANWEDLVQKYRNWRKRKPKSRWVFRGQACACWRLATSLERRLKEFEYSLDKAPAVEARLLREFQRRVHHYSSKAPQEYDTLQWLALMQHYRAPTRLLDWTYSFWVALYFAVEKPCGVHWGRPGDLCRGRKFAVWAIDANACRQEANRLLGFAKDVDLLVQRGDAGCAKKFDDLVRRRTHPKKFVYPANPFRLNKRLTAQQGVFLCPGDVAAPFQENLATMRLKDNLLMFTLHCKERQAVLRELYRMNVAGASLFPDLDGFGYSLNTRLADRDLFSLEIPPHTGE